MSKLTGADAHLDLLGKTVRDRVTGYQGAVISISFDLFGCVQAIVKPPMNKDGKVEDGQWLDVNRLEVVDEKRKMPVPSFAPKKATFGATPDQHTQGPAEKPRGRY
jgi:hypothetical protein